MDEASLRSEAETVAELLRKHRQQLVLAESCTGGLISARLAEIPGISKHLCGSAVVYQEETKVQWLGIKPGMLRQYGSVSAEVAKAMAWQALKRTPQSTIAAAITGHLGPGVSPSETGLLFIAVAHIFSKRVWVQEVRALPLPTQGVRRTERQERTLRRKRQECASHALLIMVRSLLESAHDSPSSGTFFKKRKA